jgi:hypothetical protein
MSLLSLVVGPFHEVGMRSLLIHCLHLGLILTAKIIAVSGLIAEAVS